MDQHKVYNKFMISKGRSDNLIDYSEHLDVDKAGKLFDRHVQKMEDDLDHEYSPQLVRLDLNHHLTTDELAVDHSAEACEGTMQLAEEEAPKAVHGRKLQGNYGNQVEPYVK